jgi:hypothetical protein
MTALCLLLVCVYTSPPLQDVLNVVGGMGVILPLLEQVCEAEQADSGAQETSDLLGPELTSSRGRVAMLLPLSRSSGPFLSRRSIVCLMLLLLCVMLYSVQCSRRLVQ